MRPREAVGFSSTRYRGQISDETACTTEALALNIYRKRRSILSAKTHVAGTILAAKFTVGITLVATAWVGRNMNIQKRKLALLEEEWEKRGLDPLPKKGLKDKLIQVAVHSAVGAVTLTLDLGTGVVSTYANQLIDGKMEVIGSAIQSGKNAIQEGRKAMQAGENAIQDEKNELDGGLTNDNDGEDDHHHSEKRRGTTKHGTKGEPKPGEVVGTWSSEIIEEERDQVDGEANDAGVDDKVRNNTRRPAKGHSTNKPDGDADGPKRGDAAEADHDIVEEGVDGVMGEITGVVADFDIRGDALRTGGRPGLIAVQKSIYHGIIGACRSAIEGGINKIRSEVVGWFTGHRDRVLGAYNGVRGMAGGVGERVAEGRNEIAGTYRGVMEGGISGIGSEIIGRVVDRVTGRSEGIVDAAEGRVLEAVNEVDGNVTGPDLLDKPSSHDKHAAGILEKKGDVVEGAISNVKNEAIGRVADRADEGVGAYLGIGDIVGGVMDLNVGDDGHLDSKNRRSTDKQIGNILEAKRDDLVGSFGDTVEGIVSGIRDEAVGQITNRSDEAIKASHLTIEGGVLEAVTAIADRGNEIIKASHVAIEGGVLEAATVIADRGDEAIKASHVAIEGSALEAVTIIADRGDEVIKASHAIKGGVLEAVGVISSSGDEAIKTSRAAIEGGVLEALAEVNEKAIGPLLPDDGHHSLDKHTSIDKHVDDLIESKRSEVAGAYHDAVEGLVSEVKGEAIALADHGAGVLGIYRNAMEGSVLEAVGKVDEVVIGLSVVDDSHSLEKLLSTDKTVGDLLESKRDEIIGTHRDAVEGAVSGVASETIGKITDQRDEVLGAGHGTIKESVLGAIEEVNGKPTDHDVLDDDHKLRSAGSDRHTAEPESAHGGVVAIPQIAVEKVVSGGDTIGQLADQSDEVVATYRDALAGSPGEAKSKVNEEVTGQKVRDGPRGQTNKRRKNKKN